MQRLVRTIALAAIAFVAAAMPAGANEPLKLRIVWSTTPAHLTPLIPLKTDLYRHWGKSYVVEPIRMQGSGPMLTALAAGETEISGFSYQAFALAVLNAKLDVRAISDVFSSQEPNRDNGFWARKGEIKKITDLKDKRLAVNARGSGVDASLRKMLLDHGLKDGVDYQVVEVNFSAMFAALDSKRVDLGFLVQPFDFRAERSGKYERIFTMRDSMGPQQTVLWAARDSFLQKNRAAVTDFLEDYLRLLRWLMDPANQAAAVQLVARITRLEPSEYDGWLFTNEDYHRSPVGTIDPAMLQRNVNDLHTYGVTPGTFEVAPYVDLSYVKDAAARLPPP